MKSKITSGELDRIQSAVDGVDHVARSMEQKWGVGRLRLLVDADLRFRFDEQCRLFNEAIWSGDCGEADKQSAAMIRGWQALDQVATAAGQQTLSPLVWEVAKGDGKVIAFVRTNAEAHAVAADGRYVEVWTVDEVARLAAATDFVANLKQEFPGSLVVDAGKTDVPNELNDPIMI